MSLLVAMSPPVNCRYTHGETQNASLFVIVVILCVNQMLGSVEGNKSIL